MSATDPDNRVRAVPDTSDDERYAAYVLAVLALVYVFNFLDRQILSILAERIKADLHLSDAQIGFLYGTAFAVFYSVFGIPLGRLADVWDRRRLISIGLAFWSLMTAGSALAQNVWQLTLARIGVGVGEASASPAAFSLLCDYFPPARRASVLAIYSSGIYIGAGLSLGIGGWIVDRWDAAFAGTVPPLGLRGWQVAFCAVGLPGLLLAALVRTLREPLRGQSEGLVRHEHAAERPLAVFVHELRAICPPLTVVHLSLLGAGARGLAYNIAAAIALAGMALAMTSWLGTPSQWIALGVGLYAVVSWAHALALRDPPAFALIFRTPALRYATVGFALLAFVGYGTGFWMAPFFMRVHGASAASAGLVLGGTAAVAGWLGTTLGGLWADRWRQRARAARLYVGLCAALLPTPLFMWLLLTDNTALAYALNFPIAVGSSLGIGAGASTVQDLTLPRMRAIASATYLFALTFIGLAMGPYAIGRLSVAVGDLRTAMLCTLAVNVLAVLCFALAARHLPHDEDTRIQRAREAGERVEPTP